VQLVVLSYMRAIVLVLIRLDNDDVLKVRGQDPRREQSSGTAET
jgi:hypothetical protein